MSTRSAETLLRLTLKSVLYNQLDTGSVSELQAVKLLLNDFIQSGIELDEANRVMISKSRAISPGNTDDIDLYDWANVNLGLGLGNDPVGQPAVFEEVILVIIHHVSGDGLLEILSSVPSGAAEWCPHLTNGAGNALREGGVFVLYQPSEDALDVVDGSSHRLRMSAIDDWVTYDIIVVGRHDDNASSSSSSSTSTLSSSSSSTTLSCSTLAETTCTS